MKIQGLAEVIIVYIEAGALTIDDGYFSASLFIPLLFGSKKLRADLTKVLTAIIRRPAAPDDLETALTLLRHLEIDGQSVAAGSKAPPPGVLEFLDEFERSHLAPTGVLRGQIPRVRAIWNAVLAPDK